jgi:hypothetical protein
MGAIDVDMGVANDTIAFDVEDVIHGAEESV